MPEFNRQECSWRDAITRVLEESTEPMHYADIADKVGELGLRRDVGANPAATVNGIIWTTMNRGEPNNSPFIRVGRGLYWLRKDLDENQALQEIQPTAGNLDETVLIHAFGMYWSRDKVSWETTPKIFGKQQERSTPVDFYEQQGVYLLHNGHTVVYVGRTTEQPLGQRLRQHTGDRLNGRWDKFSWFGVYPVSEHGRLEDAEGADYTLTMLIVTMEALLIEGLEPPQNRKRGDDFRAVEFIQVEDKQIRMNQKLELIDELRNNL